MSVYLDNIGVVQQLIEELKTKTSARVARATVSSSAGVLELLVNVCVREVMVWRLQLDGCIFLTLF